MSTKEDVSGEVASFFTRKGYCGFGLPLLFRVTCKVHNICGVERLKSNETLSADYQNGDDSADDTEMFRGRRTDLEQTDTRNNLVLYLKSLQVVKPRNRETFTRVSRA